MILVGFTLKRNFSFHDLAFSLKKDTDLCDQCYILTLSNVSINLLAYYHECRFLIGYVTVTDSE